MSLPLLIRSPDLLGEDPTLVSYCDLSYLPKALSPTTVTLGVRVSTYEF